MTLKSFAAVFYLGLLLGSTLRVPLAEGIVLGQCNGIGYLADPLSRRRLFISSRVISGLAVSVRYLEYICFIHGIDFFKKFAGKTINSWPLAFTRTGYIQYCYPMRVKPFDGICGDTFQAVGIELGDKARFA